MLQYTPGDANHNCLVDIHDLASLCDNWLKTGRMWEQGDFTGEGNVDLSDFAYYGRPLLENTNP